MNAPKPIRVDLAAEEVVGSGAPDLIRVDGVSKTYPTRSGNIRAIDRVDLQIREGEFVSVVGPSGCGKSTLKKMIAGLIPPTAGTIEIRGRPVRGPVTDAGIVFQSDLLLEWRKVIGNVLLQVEMRKLAKSAYEPRARELLKLMGLEGFEDKLPSELSGGMRQRVSLCRALIHDPPLLLMDEPFGALDALTREQLNLDLQNIWLRSKKTVVFITHSIMEAIFLSDRVAVMGPRPGLIVEEVVVDLDRPRRLSVQESPDFAAHVRRVREAFEQMGLLREAL